MGAPHSHPSSGVEDEPTGNPDLLASRIYKVLGWAKALQHIAECRDVQGDAIMVIGEALDTLAGHMADDYRALHAERTRSR